MQNNTEAKPQDCPNCGHHVTIHDDSGVCPVMSCECPVPMPENRRA